MKKIKNIILTVVLSCCSIFTAFGLVGCGNVSLSTLESNFEKLEALYSSNSSVFGSDYEISYGDVVDGYVKVALLSTQDFSDSSTADDEDEGTYYLNLYPSVYYNSPDVPDKNLSAEDDYTKDYSVASYTVSYNGSYSSPTSNNSKQIESSSASGEVTVSISSISEGYQFCAWAMLSVYDDSENTYIYEIKSTSQNATFDVSFSTEETGQWRYYLMPIFYVGSEEIDFDEYLELSTLYNETLKLALNFVDSSKDYVLTLNEDSMSSSTKSAITTLNSSLTDYIDSISDFLSALTTLKSHFASHSVSLESDSTSLLRFKAYYGKMVTSAVTLSVSMEEVVAESGIYDSLKQVTPADGDAETIKEYICAKLLPIFSEFSIGEVASVMKWSATKDGDCKSRIQDLLDTLNEHFEEFKTLSATSANNLDSETINKLFDYAEMFFVEMESYFDALYGLDLRTLAVTYENNLQNYLSENSFAEIYLAKLEQFLNYTLPNFMEQISNIITSE